MGTVAAFAVATGIVGEGISFVYAWALGATGVFFAAALLAPLATPRRPHGLSRRTGERLPICCTGAGSWAKPLIGRP